MGLLGESLGRYPEQNEAIDVSISCCPGSKHHGCPSHAGSVGDMGKQARTLHGSFVSLGREHRLTRVNPFRTDRECLAFGGAPRVLGVWAGAGRGQAWALARALMGEGMEQVLGAGIAQTNGEGS